MAGELENAARKAVSLEQLYKLIAESIYNIIFAVTKFGRMISVNVRAEAVTRLSGDILRALRISDIVTGKAGQVSVMRWKQSIG